jgi:serine/threonine protein kinase
MGIVYKAWQRHLNRLVAIKMVLLETGAKPEILIRFRQEAELAARLRRDLGHLIGVPADDIILANSASYGLHLLANGLPVEGRG